MNFTSNLISLLRLLYGHEKRFSSVILSIVTIILFCTGQIASAQLSPQNNSSCGGPTVALQSSTSGYVAGLHSICLNGYSGFIYTDRSLDISCGGRSVHDEVLQV